MGGEFGEIVRGSKEVGEGVGGGWDEGGAA